ncbi:FAD:protein FMN transferase [Isoptericola sp. 178]|uniref:FAD:protein FMN transferase n=1 Tax=Isoptericola sp. 178 TaxID=3064651 RepID=UPI002712312F|nr:FAD:protein FMN transferase [Isoptericola sp. 178]MDO8144385.1 FAD:protein FMN transferase [Isoptericola sp. 178]
MSGAGTRPAVRRRVVHVMGMPVSVALRGRHAEGPAADRAWDRVVAELRHVDATFSTYRADSVISRLARGEIGVDALPGEVREVLALGEEARRASDGAFDVVQRHLDGTETFDPSGVVKGWAVERAARHLRDLEGTDFCLSAGGDMVCHVAGDDAEPWRVGIEDPHAPARLVAVVPVRDGAVATSGLAHRGDHVVDARSGRTPTALASVTVVGPSLTWADIDATSAFALGADGRDWLRTRPGETGLVVWADGRAEPFAGIGSR